MAENTEPTTEETEVEAHVEKILPLQELAGPETVGVAIGAGKSTFSIGC